MSANTAKKSIRSFFTAIPSTTSNKKPRSDSVTSMLETPAATTSVENLLLKDETECTDDPMITSNSVESLNLSHGSNRPVDIELVGWQPFDTMEHSWRERLIKECKKPYFQNLLAFLQGEVSRGVTIFPPASQIFTAFNLCPFGNVKVVVIGQDPYHGECQAHGLAFSVQKNIQIPPSLRNMITEAMNDPKIRITNPNHGNLECWSKQGVLMLNTVLTVRKAEANSHQKKGRVIILFWNMVVLMQNWFVVGKNSRMRLLKN